MLNITNRAKNVSPSLTLAITAKANKLKESGVDIVSFAAGEPDFNTPEFIVNAAKDALDKGLTKYTPASGIAPLKKAVCAKLKRDNALDYQPEQIVISTGAKQSLFNTLQTVCQEGDEVIIISPYWLTYPELIKICGAKPVVVETKAEEGFALNVGLIEKAVTDKTRALILNMPNNPSGTVYGREKIEELAAMLRRHPDDIARTQNPDVHAASSPMVWFYCSIFSGQRQRTQQKNAAEVRHYSTQKGTALRLCLCDEPGGIRTHDLLIRSQTLYPAELRAHVRVRKQRAVHCNE